MAFNPSLKGLNTEVTPQSAGEDSLLDVADMVISQTDKLESRHGVNVQTIPNFFQYSASNANVSVFKIPFSTEFATSSGYTTKYVLLSGASSTFTELVTSGNFASLVYAAGSSLPVTYTRKPLGFTFDQSFYVVGANGWQEMKIDTLDSGLTRVKKVIQWPPFTDINIETFQDTQDFSANWLDIDKKVGIRLTYVWNTRYNDETPREVESEPSQIFEVLHPMALRTQVTGSGVTNTIKDKSRIRIRIGENFTPFIRPFEEYSSLFSRGRRFYIRVYRTKQVDINEALPTEYFTAFPDIEMGVIAQQAFDTSSTPSLVNTTTDYLNFETQVNNWKNGSLVKYVTTGTGIGLDNNGLYYLGQQSGTSYRFFNTPLLTNHNNLTSVGSGTQYIIRVHEANLTVNDDGIQSLPQLYTNPNLDGEPNRNSIPPIAESVVEYKNYHVAANIREPLRAYITLVNQPLVKTIKTNTSITITTPRNIGSSITCDTGFDLTGITSNNFAIDSAFWYNSTPNITVLTNTSFSTGGDNSDTLLTGPNPNTGNIRDLCALFQTNATIKFRFDSNNSLTSTATVIPKYNRPDLYVRTNDNNLEFLEYSGAVSDGYGSVYLGFNAGNTRGKAPLVGKFATLNSVILNASGDLQVTVSNADTLDIAKLSEPGIIAVQFAPTSPSGPGNPGIFSYKTITKSSTNIYTFTGTTRVKSGSSGSYPGPTGTDVVNIYYVDSSTVSSAPLYLNQIPTVVSVINGDPDYASRDLFSSKLGLSFSPTNGYYDQPIAVYNTTNATTGFINTLMLGNLALSPAQLLDRTVSNLVQSLNDQNTIPSVKYVKTDNVGEFYVEY
jgi:hypothetical protein